MLSKEPECACSVDLGNTNLPNNRLSVNSGKTMPPRVEPSGAGSRASGASVASVPDAPARQRRALLPDQSHKLSAPRGIVIGLGLALIFWSIVGALAYWLH